VRRPTSLRHDAAEAVLIGLWGVVAVGLLPGYPSGIVHGTLAASLRGDTAYGFNRLW